MGCKRPVRLLLQDEEGEECRVDGFLHPRGCMGARQQHLDIPVDESCRPSSLLADAGYRGHEARCYTIGGCIVVDLSGLGLPTVQVCLEGEMLSCPSIVYLRRRQGRIYLGPVVLG